jgi:tetratricopeptide (TPR) repeat protein
VQFTGPQRTGVVKKVDIDRANNAYAKAIELLYDLKQLPKTLALFNEAIAVRPKIANWYVARAQVHRSMGRYQQAFFDYNAAVRLDAKQPGYYCARAIVLRKLKRFTDAISDLNTALNMQANNPAFCFYRGVTYMDIEDYENALKDFNVSVQLSRCATVHSYLVVVRVH